MYNQYYKNRTNNLVGQQQSEAVDFYIPIGAILVELQDRPNNLERIESNNIHIIGSDSNNRISVYAISTILTGSNLKAEQHRDVDWLRVVAGDPCTP